MSGGQWEDEPSNKKKQCLQCSRKCQKYNREFQPSKHLQDMTLTCSRVPNYKSSMPKSYNIYLSHVQELQNVSLKFFRVTIHYVDPHNSHNTLFQPSQESQYISLTFPRPSSSCCTPIPTCRESGLVQPILSLASPPMQEPVGGAGREKSSGLDESITTWGKIAG